MYCDYLLTPIGWLEISADEIGITGVYFVETQTKMSAPNQWIEQAKNELLAYFERKRKHFDVPLHILNGTSFQRKCWDALLTIPYGKTRSYYEEACIIGNPKAVRAVGGANHHNPISIIIPCHRVIAKNGTLCGYGGGVLRKEFLLQLEAGDEE